MKLRLGQKVDTTDGPFGELADIVIDPVLRTVTHLVVQPHRQHHLARLVPMWLIEVGADTITVKLDAKHLRQLQHVAESEFLRLDDAIDVGGDWDIGTEDVIAMPYYVSDMGFGAYDNDVNVSYDRIPKGESEIRRSSEVRSSDHHVVGHVEGFLADDEHLAGVIVATGLPGLRHLVVIPMGYVGRVATDRIELDMDRSTFKRLPPAEGLAGPFTTPPLERFERTAGRLARRVRDGAAALTGKARRNRPGGTTRPG